MKRNYIRYRTALYGKGSVLDIKLKESHDFTVIGQPYIELPFTIGEGDCNDDEECAGSLICGHNNCLK